MTKSFEPSGSSTDSRERIDFQAPVALMRASAARSRS